MRSFLYFLAKLLGDMNAITKGKIGKRVTRRLAGKITNRGMNRLFK